MDLFLLHMENCGETETARCDVSPLSLDILILQLSDLEREFSYLNLAVSKYEVSDGYDLYTQQTRQ